MKRLIAAAAALLLTLAACDQNTIVGFDPADAPTYISIVVGLTAGEVLDPGDDEDISQVLGEEWVEQERANRLEDAVNKAEGIALMLPDLIDISISDITFDQNTTIRPSLWDDGCGGYMAVLLDALENAGYDYHIQGETTALEEAHVIIMPSGREVLANVRVMEYYLRLNEPVHRDENKDAAAGHSHEPRYDPPTTREKRAGG
ncbi:hypothetical protein ACFL6R_03010 [Gemmatimonadota bacterium]